uniref:Methionine aminopeptidase n=1 Tax=Hirondellea gigas TaxID=1518452 RepID=A0A6A7GAP7_9CRUS
MRSRAVRLLRRFYHPDPKLRKVPDHIHRAPYYESGIVPIVPEIDFSNPNAESLRERIAIMRKACQLASYTRAFAGALVRDGISCDEIDRLTHEECIHRGYYPAPLNFKGFPKSLTCSVNEEICHGIPSQRLLKNGDIVKLDCSVFYEDHYGDCCGTFLVGEVDDVGQRLHSTTIQCVNEAIKICRPGVRFTEIGKTIQDIADEAGFGVVAEYAGHGIGKNLHTSPSIIHIRNAYHQGEMVPGMTFTIEPVLTEGSPTRRVLADGWTVVTCDGKRSAQHEETILITENGSEILTQHPSDLFHESFK